MFGFLQLVLMLYYFFLIGEVAEDYFAPTMAGLSEVLHLPHNVAGVTFLAIGSFRMTEIMFKA